MPGSSVGQHDALAASRPVRDRAAPGVDHERGRSQGRAPRRRARGRPHAPVQSKARCCCTATRRHFLAAAPAPAEIGLPTAWRSPSQFQADQPSACPTRSSSPRRPAKRATSAPPWAGATARCWRPRATCSTWPSRRTSIPPGSVGRPCCCGPRAPVRHQAGHGRQQGGQAARHPRRAAHGRARLARDRLRPRGPTDRPGDPGAPRLPRRGPAPRTRLIAPCARCWLDRGAPGHVHCAGPQDHPRRLRSRQAERRVCLFVCGGRPPQSGQRELAPSARAATNSLAITWLGPA